MDSGVKPWATLEIERSSKPRKRKPLLIGIISLCVAALVALGVMAKPVTVQVDGKSYHFITFRQTVGDFLQHSNLNVYPQDFVRPSRQSSLKRGMTIALKRSVPIKIKLDNRQVAFRTLAKTVGQALDAAGKQYDFKLKNSDEVNPDRDSLIKPGISIQVRFAVPLTIVADGVTHHIEMPPDKVKTILDRQRITVGANDLVTPSLNQIVAADTTIKVVRVTQQVVTEQSEVPYQLVNQPGDFPVGLPDRVISAGQMGVAEKTVKITYEDGVETGQETLSQSIVKPPVNEIVARGAQTTVSRGGSIINFRRAILVRATAYSAPGGSTSLGVPVHHGVVAVDPSVISYHSSLWIDGYGWGTALDTGGAIVGNAIDVYFDNVQDARNWGVKYVIVYIK